MDIVPLFPNYSLPIEQPWDYFLTQSEIHIK